MANILYDPYINPVRFYLPQPDKTFHSRFFEDFEFFDTLEVWHPKLDYFQPWQTSDVISLQLQADFGPHTVRLLDEDGNVVPGSDVQYTQLAANNQNPSLHLYILNYDLSSVTPGVYRMQRISGIDNPLIVQSNRLHILQTHKLTLCLDYQDAQYHEGAFFQDASGTNIFAPRFRVEGKILEKTPATKGAPDYEDQGYSLKTVRKVHYNTYDLIIGDRKGVPYSVVDLVDLIFTCSDVKADGRSFTLPVDAKWEPNELDGWKAKGWKTEIRPSNNRPSRVYVNNHPQSARVSVMISVGSKGFGTNTGGTTYHISDVE